MRFALWWDHRLKIRLLGTNVCAKTRGRETDLDKIKIYQDENRNPAAGWLACDLSPAENSLKRVPHCRVWPLGRCLTIPLW